MMETNDTATGGASTSRRTPGRPGDEAQGWDGRDENGAWPADGYHGRHSVSATSEPPVARRTATGWRVGDEEVSDLTSAMVRSETSSSPTRQPVAVRRATGGSPAPDTE